MIIANGTLAEPSMPTFMGEFTGELLHTRKLYEGHPVENSLILHQGTAKAAAFVKAKNGPPPDLSGGYKYLKLERMSCYVHKDAYRNAVRAAAKALA